MKTQYAIAKNDAKIVYYMSMEFLMGRALGNNLINLTAYEQVQETMEELGIDLNAIEDEERDPAGVGEWRSWKTGSLLSGFTIYVGLSSLWLRDSLSLWNVSSKDGKWISN